jgi:C2 domain of PTEN tumour-suppressor protein
MSFSMRGDTKIMFNHKTSNMFRIMFNTSFIQNGNYIHAGKMELSPEDIRKDNGKTLPNDFKIYIFFEDFCEVCNPYTTELADLCPNCVKELGPEVI